MQALLKQMITITAEQLNHSCHCVSLNKNILSESLSGEVISQEVYRMMADRPHLFAESAVFISQQRLEEMLNIIKSIEQVIASHVFQKAVLAQAPEIAHYQPKAAGVFMGYDFHLSEDGPKLIEINTNAGGAMLNAKLIHAQMPCCEKVAEQQPGKLSVNTLNVSSHEQLFLNMFYHEWQLERGDRPLKTIAIVDQQPETQYLLPEFLLFKQLFEQQQIKAIICDPKTLTYRDGALWYGDITIDLIYNRLTDFSLQAENLAAIRTAYLADAVVLTPHPRNHALYANKKNLILLSDSDFLQTTGLGEKSIACLIKGVAHTIQVNEVEAEQLWADRKQLFFKPAKGFGSKATYRGDKLTRKVFNDIVHQDYVAQTLIMPSYRELEVNQQAVSLKLDLRHYVYQGQTQMVCARLYQGQTTNFRTPGGGFAQVVVVS